MSVDAFSIELMLVEIPIIQVQVALRKRLKIVWKNPTSVPRLRGESLAKSPVGKADTGR